MTTNSYHHNDSICSNLYQQGFKKGLYSDLSLTFVLLPSITNTKIPNGTGITEPESITFKLHKLIVSKSSFLKNVIDTQETINGIQQLQADHRLINVQDTLVGREGLSLAIGHLYCDNTQHLVHDSPPNILCSALASAQLLNLDQLSAIINNQIKSTTNLRTIVEYANLLENTEYECSRDLMDFLFTWLCKVCDVIVSNVGLVWGHYDSQGYKVLLQIFQGLPFGWLKSVLESKYFACPSDMERYNSLSRFEFAKRVVQDRKRLLDGSWEENVLFSFGNGSKGVTVVRKRKSVSSKGRKSTNSITSPSKQSTTATAWK